MSGDEKKTYHFMKTGPRVLDVEKLSQQMGALEPDYLDDAMRKLVAEVGVAVGSMHDETVIEVRHEVDLANAELRVMAQGVGGGGGLATRVPFPPTANAISQAGMKIEANIRKILATQLDQNALRAAEKSVLYTMDKTQHDIWMRRYADAMRMGVDPHKYAGPMPTPIATVPVAAVPDVHPDPRILVVQLPQALGGKVVGLQVVHSSNDENDQSLVGVMLTLNPDETDKLSLGDIFLGVNSGHVKDPKHTHVGTTHLSLEAEKDSEIAKLEEMIDEHTKRYDESGVMKRLQEALTLLANVKENAKTVSAAITGQIDASRINPQASYLTINTLHIRPISGKFVQEFLLDLDKIDKLLDPAKAPPPSGKKATTP